MREPSSSQPHIFDDEDGLALLTFDLTPMVAILRMPQKFMDLDSSWSAWKDSNWMERLRPPPPPLSPSRRLVRLALLEGVVESRLGFAAPLSFDR